MNFVRTFKKIITHPLIAGPIGGLCIVLLSYLDSKYKEKKIEKATYYKLFIVSSLVFSTIIYFVSVEYTKTDEFLKQNYDTKIPSFKPISKKMKGGDFVQPDMPKPDMSSLGDTSGCV